MESQADVAQQENAPDRIPADAVARLAEALGPGAVLLGGDAGDDYCHDESLSARHLVPGLVVWPTTAAEVSTVLSWANERSISVTARGSGTGLSGACVPGESGGPGGGTGIVVSFERMARILEVDPDNFVAVVEPGVRLSSLDEKLAPLGLAYSVYPGEYSASIGGNIATNAGGMRAVKYGVTRQNVLGLQIVLATGEVMETGARAVKLSTGYDLTQLVIGSEGTLALITKAVLRLVPRARRAATILAPFATLDEVARAVPRILAGGIAPSMLEYIDVITMAAMVANADMNLGVPANIRESAAAYLLIGLEDTGADRLEQDIETAGDLVSELGALDVFVLPAPAAKDLIEARERAFWVAKAAEADDIVDTVVPRAAIPEFLAHAQQIGQEHGAYIAGCGHAGDGNVHLAVFCRDDGARDQVLRELFTEAMRLGGAISGEHGLGTEKKKYFQELENPAKIALMRRVKAAFDPNGILNPGKVFD